MPGKRGNCAGRAAAAKKIRADSVTEKVNAVIEALKDTECEIPEPAEATRSALLAVLPHTLGPGAASNERHGYQSSVVGVIGQVLAATEAKWQRKRLEAVALHDAAKADQASRDDALALIRGHLEAQRAEEARCREAFQADAAQHKAAEMTAHLANSKFENFDTIQAAKADEREQFAAALSEDFEVLIASVYAVGEQKRLNRITSLLRKLPSTDASLLSALPPALAKKPSDRGIFDETVISNVETALKERLASLDADLGNADRSQKESLAKEATATLNLIKHEFETSRGKLEAVEQKRKELEAEELKIDTDFQEQADAVSDLDIQAFNFKVFLQNSQEVLAAFAFLRDRVETEDTEGKGTDENQMVAEEDEPAAIAAMA